MSWTKEQHEATRQRINREAERARVRLGARTVAMICFFEDGKEPMVICEGGKAPITAYDLYSQLAAAYAQQGLTSLPGLPKGRKPS